MNTSGNSEEKSPESMVGEVVKAVVDGAGNAGNASGGTVHTEGFLDDIGDIAGGIVNTMVGGVAGAVGGLVGGGVAGTIGNIVTGNLPGIIGDVIGGTFGGGNSNTDPHYHNAYTPPPGGGTPSTGGTGGFLGNVVGGINGGFNTGGIMGAVGGIGGNSGSHYHSASPVGGNTNVPGVPSVFGGSYTGTPPTGYAGKAPGTGTVTPPGGHAGTAPGGNIVTPPGGIPGGTGTINTPLASHSGTSFTVGGTPGHSSGGAGPGSIILEPRQMFQTLQQMENATQDLLKLIHEVTEILEAVSILTFAVGFGELIKMAEIAINQVGSAVVAANNAFNRACKDVINQLVAKFATEGAKSDYSSPAFIEITIKINIADRAQVEPAQMKAHFDNHQQKNTQLSNKTNDMRDIYRNTSSFWIGHSADKTRSNFESKIVPHFEELHSTLARIVEQGFSWIEETLRFEASLGI